MAAAGGAAVGSAAAAAAGGGVRMPPMMYGTAWKKERTTALLETAVLAGFRGIDTACQPKHYREDLVGQALVKLQQTHGIQRSSLFIQTKFTPIDGQDRSQPLPYDPKASLAEQVCSSASTSLRNLATDYIDSLLLHSPCRTHEQSMQVWRAFEGLVEAGQVRQLGISNIYDLRALQDIYHDADVKPAVVQNRFYSKTGFDREIRAFCKQQGITYQSFWTLTANPDALGSQAVKAAAAARRCAPEQVWYRYVMQLGLVPLNGTTSKQHMAQDLGVVGWGQPLTAQEMRDIGKVIGEDA